MLRRLLSNWGLLFLLLALGSSQARVQAAPNNDNYANAAIIAGTTGSTSGSTVGATTETSEYLPYYENGRTVWYKWTAPTTGGISFKTSNSTFTNTISVFSGGFTSNNLFAKSSNGTCVFHGVAGQTYQIAIDGPNGKSGTFALSWNGGPANDDFAAAQTITGLPGTTSGTTVEASTESSEYLPYYENGSTVWYKWTASATGGVAFKTSNSTFTNTISVFSGGFTSNNLVARSSNGTCVFHGVAGQTYQIAIDGPNGQSGAFTLSWNGGPANDDFANAAIITGLPGSTSGTTVEASTESGEYLPYYENGSTVWYKWTAPATGGVAFKTSNTTFTNTISVFFGGFSSNNLVARSSNGTCVFHGVAGQTYQIAIDGPNGQSGTFALSWNRGPANDDFAAAQTITSVTGSTSGTTVEASTESGEYLPYYENGSTVWYKWTAPFTGGIAFKTSNTTFTNTISAFSGGFGSNNLVAKSSNGTCVFHAVAGQTYRIAIDGPNGQSGPFTLNWNRGPANDDYAAAQAVTTFSVDVTGTTVGSTSETGESLNYYENGSTIWYKWTAPASGGATFSTDGSDFPNIISVFSGGFASGNLVVRSPNAGTNSAVASFSAVAGQTYQIAVDGQSGLTGNVVLFGGTAPLNDNFAKAQILTGPIGITKGINLPASTELGEPAHAGVQGGASVWFQWTAPANGIVTFDTDGSTIDTLLAVYTGKDVAHLTTIVSNDNDDNGVNGSSRVSLTATGGTTYYIAVDGIGGQTGHYTLHWSGPPAMTHAAWNYSDGTFGLWDYDAVSGAHSLMKYGPFSGWTVKAIADGPDSLTRVLWTNANGQLILWTLNNITRLYASKTFTPSAGLTPVTISVGVDNTTHVLLTNSAGQATIWNYTTGNASFTSHTYTPPAGWTAKAMAEGQDGLIHLLWANATGQAMVWNVDNVTSTWTSHTFGPFSGWSVRDLSVASNGITHLLWTHTNGNTCVWNLNNTTGAYTTQTYGLSNGLTPKAITDGSDGKIRILWTNAANGISIWQLDNTTRTFIAHPYVPGAGWTAIDVAAH